MLYAFLQMQEALTRSGCCAQNDNARKMIADIKRLEHHGF
jgi:hypothetical protein